MPVWVTFSTARCRMWMTFFGYYFLGFFGWFLAVLIVGALLLLIVCWCCGVSLDSMMTWGDGNASLTCFHCGRETQANRKTCEHCDGELQ